MADDNEIIQKMTTKKVNNYLETTLIMVCCQSSIA